MARAPSPFALFQPWTLWMQWAAQSMEMWLAAGQVIGHRTHRMARVGHRPSARDRKEFLLMGTEKIDAATQSWLGMLTVLAPRAKRPCFRSSLRAFSSARKSKPACA